MVLIDDYQQEGKKWDRVEAENYFIKSIEHVTSKSLAEKSSRDLSTIKRWRKRYDWVRKRAEFWEEVRGASNEKAVDRISDIFTDNFADLADAHLKRYQRFSEFADLILNNIIKEVQESPDLGAALKRVDVKELNQLLLICDRAMRGAGDSVGLQIQIDANRAIESVEKMGYVVLDPTSQDGDNRNLTIVPTEAKKIEAVKDCN